MTDPAASDQWIRKASLIVSDDAGAGLELSNFRIRFKTNQSDIQTPNSIAITISNLSTATTAKIKKEYTQVRLAAGYENGAFGQIFAGTIKQFKSGRESATDTFLTILAADGDIAHNFAVMNQTFAAGSTPDERAAAVAGSMSPYGVDPGYKPARMTGGVLPRGKVMYGMARDEARIIGDTTLTSWSIQNGKLTFIPLTGYLPSEAVVLNAGTGMIGMPEQTDNGIGVRCLLNPKLQIGGLVKIDNAAINQTTNVDPSNPTPFDQYTGIQLLASVADDGLYRIFQVEYVGDTRGNDWYADLVCLSVDQSSPIDSSVLMYG